MNSILPYITSALISHTLKHTSHDMYIISILKPRGTLMVPYNIELRIVLGVAPLTNHSYHTPLHTQLAMN